MNDSGQVNNTRKLRRVTIISVHITLLGSLAACTETPFFNHDNAKTGTPSSTEVQTDSSISADGNVNVETSALESPELGTAAPVVPTVIINSLAVVERPTTDTLPDTSASTANTAADPDSDFVSSDGSSGQGTAPPITEGNDTDTPDNTGVAGNEPGDSSISDPAPPFEASNENPVTDVVTDSWTDAYTDALGESKNGSATSFTSHTTPGFTGEVIDNSIHVTWNQDSDALGYNIYRQAKYVTTVWDNNYVESDLFDQDYYYEIQAFDKTKQIYYYVATGLTVSVRTAGRTDPAKPKPNPDQLQDYQLIFSDEFNGNSLDTSKWNTALLWGDEIIINGEVQFYVDIKNKPDFGFNPFTFDGENLTINSVETPGELSQKALGQPYLSGVITSYNALQFIYGYVETRARVTFGRGYWPAFWLLNAYYGQGGDDPEIDIMEFVGHDQDVVYHTYHYYDADGALRSTESKPTPGIDYTADFHTFGVEWKPGTIIYFVDGIEVHRVTDPKVSQQTMYLIANTAMGGWWAGNPDEATPFPGKYVIDYIRVYQRTTPYDDVLLNDGMTEVTFTDDIPGQATPNHRPSPEQWPEGYPHRQ